MTTILAIEGSGDFLSVGLQHQANWFVVEQTQRRKHNETLLPCIEQLLAQAGIGLADLNLITFSAGPGSFTGLRLCASVVQAIAFSHQIPVLAISSLAVLAQAALDAGQTGPYLIAEDARRDQLYLGAYETTNEGIVTALLADQLVAHSQLAAFAWPNVTAATPLGGAWQLAALQGATAQIKVTATNPPVPANALALCRLAQSPAWQGAIGSAETALPFYLQSAPTHQTQAVEAK